MKYLFQFLVPASFGLLSLIGSTRGYAKVDSNVFVGESRLLAFVNTLGKGLERLGTNEGTSSFEITNFEVFKLVGLIGFCCLTLAVVISKYRKVLKSDKHEFEAQIRKTKERLDALRKRQLLLTEEFARSSNRLKDVVEQLENKRQVLSSIRQLVELTSGEQLINPETKSKFSRIGRNIQYSIHADQEWHHFRSYFENANEKFLANLKERFPKLSPNDYKLCVLYKADSDHERVASIMEISAESARVMKHRLKKKLELPLNACLSTFLTSFDHQEINKPLEV